MYSFTDTYFYDANDQFDRSSIKYYKRCLQKDDGIYWDPIIRLLIYILDIRWTNWYVIRNITGK